MSNTIPLIAKLFDEQYGESPIADHVGLNLLVDVVHQQPSIMAFNDVARATAIFSVMALFLLPLFHSKKSLRKSNPKLSDERTNREIKIKSD